MKRRLLALAATSAAALLLAGCTGTTSGSSSAGGPIAVVTSTDVYGQIVSEIGGDAVSVTPIIDSPSKDPHEYEATAADQLAVQKAALLVENGGGYDGFLDSLIETGGAKAPVIVAAEYSSAWPDGAANPDQTAATLTADPHAEQAHNHDHIDGFNEHVWYDPATMRAVANAIANELGALDPSHADVFAANASAFSKKIGTLEDALAQIRAKHSGAQVFVTEPVPGYLVAAAGLQNVTPDAFSEAVEAGNDVPPATLLAATTLLKSGAVKLLIANAQTGGPSTTQAVDTAKAAGIPVLEFTETLPAGQTYIPWMQQNIDQIAQALGA